MKTKHIFLLAALCLCAAGCNTDDAAATSGDSEKGYEDDGTGNDIANSKFTKTITITFSQSQATIDGEADSVAISSDGAYVTITSKAEEMEYKLYGSTTNGGLKVYSDKKFKLALCGVELTSGTGAAINNQSKKKMFVYLADATNNSLTDAATYADTPAGEDEKAALFSEGQMIICGQGTLSVTSRCKHAICSDDYVAIRDEATVNIGGSVKDGIHANDYVAIDGGATTIAACGSDGIDVDEGYFLMTAGQLNVTTTAAAAKAVKATGNIFIRGGALTLRATGGTEYDSEDRDYKTAACLSSDSSIYISDGSISATCTGLGGKALKADSDIVIDGGYVEAESAGQSNNYVSAKGVKAKGDIVINGGRVVATSASHEGIESKGSLTIAGGIVEVEAKDDAINSGADMRISGGMIYAHGSDNDGLDSNGNLYIEGGTVVAFGTSSPECGIDANEEENYHLYITGGTVIGVGGGTSYPNSTTGSQAAVAMTAGLSNLALKDASGNTLLAWDYANYATEYSGNKAGGFPGGGGPGGNQGGGQSGQWTVLLSTPSMETGTTYYLYTGVTVGGDTFHGLSTGAAATGGSQAASATASVTAGGGGSQGGGPRF